MAYTLYLLVFLGLIVMFLGGYTKNVQATTLELGKKISIDDPNLPTGLQDAITPSWQTRNNIIFFIVVALFGVQCFVALPWYYAVGTFLVVLLFGVPLISLTVVPKPMSKSIIQKITANLQERRKGFEKRGEQAKVEAAEFVLDRIKEYEEETR